jgi:hypothetical protein
MMGLLGAIILTIIIGGGAARHYDAARRKFEAMSTAQAQQAQINQSQRQAAQAAQTPSQGKKDPVSRIVAVQMNRGRNST